MELQPGVEREEHLDQELVNEPCRYVDTALLAMSELSNDSREAPAVGWRSIA